MKILQINATYKMGSTGKIVEDLDNSIKKSGNKGYILCAYTNVKKNNLYYTEFFNPEISMGKNIFISRLTGTMGYKCKIKTYKAIKWIDTISPDLIHFHNIHGDWINLKMIIKYINKKKIPVIWTLHDCWSFTGRCSHFENVNCMKWKTGCYDCNNLKVYPISYFFDKSKKCGTIKRNGLLH